MTTVYGVLLLIIFFSVFMLSFIRLNDEKMRREAVYLQYIRASSGVIHPERVTATWANDERSIATYDRDDPLPLYELELWSAEKEENAREVETVVEVDL